MATPGSITSIKEERIVLARDVRTRRGRLQHGRILLEGEATIDWALERSVCVDYLLICDKASPALCEKYLALGLDTYRVSEGILRKVTDTSYLIPVVGVARTPAGSEDSRADFVVVLDSVQDPGNIGTIIRTCQAFGVRTIVSTRNDLDIYQRKTIEASRGSVFSSQLVGYRDAAETIRQLKGQGYQIVATSPSASDLQSLVELKRQPVALVVGNETNGISPELERGCDLLIRIPMSPTVESLNVGVAAGISIYELRLKQVLAMIEERIRSTLGRELNVAGALVQRALDVELKKVCEWTSRQVVFMMVLKCDRKTQIEDMCRQFGVLENEAESFLKPLVEHGLVSSNGGLELTRAGEETLAKLWPAVETAQAKILADLSAEDVDRLFRQLQVIRERCVQIIGGA